jgi:protein arginine kinase
METQPAHLQYISKQKLSAEERDNLRADLIRERLKNFPKPPNTKVSGDGPSDPT